MGGENRRFHSYVVYTGECTRIRAVPARPPGGKNEESKKFYLLWQQGFMDFVVFEKRKKCGAFVQIRPRVEE